jgi:transposase
MSQRSNYAIAVIGIDIGKNSFHVVGQDQRGAIVLRQKWSRGQVDARLANLPPCLIGMEACVGAHHLSRKLHLLGHNARLMPAKYVRPYSKGQKNDFRDAEAIAEAVQRPTMKFVATKTADQLDLQALHRVRERLVSQRTGIINQIRAFLLERGVAVRQGLHFLRAELPDILATRTDVLSPRMVRIIDDLSADWRRLDGRIEGRSGEIETFARQDQHCERLMTVRRSPASAHDLERDGGCDRHRRRVLQRPRLRRLARAGPEANLDRRPDDPWQHIKARQSLSARPVRSGSLGRAGQARAQAVGTLWAQILDRGGEEATALQCARHCAG